MTPKGKSKNEEIETFIWNPKSLSFWKIRVNANDIEWLESVSKRWDIYQETKTKVENIID